jgi:hypothetical protein
LSVHFNSTLSLVSLAVVDPFSIGSTAVLSFAAHSLHRATIYFFSSTYRNSPKMSTTITTNADPAATATNPTNNNNTWMERMRLALCSTNNGGRYEPVMRRSLQTCLLYEAKRVVDANYQDLRPFQRKLAFYDVLHALVDSICFLPLPQMRAELLWRTATSKVPLDADVAWKRAKLIEKEMARLAQEVKPLVVAGRSHAESVTMLVQQLFVRIVCLLSVC